MLVLLLGMTCENLNEYRACGSRTANRTPDSALTKSPWTDAFFGVCFNLNGFPLQGGAKRLTGKALVFPV